MITNENQFVDTFGEPSPSLGYGAYAALMYLRKGLQLWYTRVGSTSLETAGKSIKEDTETNVTLQVLAKSPGEWGNDVTVQILDGVGSGLKKCVVTYGQDSEVFNELSVNETSDNFWETVLNEQSRFVNVDYQVGDYGQPKNGTYALVGGDNGLTGITDADYIGSYSGGVATGLQTFANPETHDINTVAIPGVTSAAAVNAVISLCESRNDCLGLIDPPFGQTVQEVVDWHNGVGFPHSSFASNKAALYWPWLRVYDQYNAQNVWLPPSGFSAQVIAHTDSVTYPWFAPAGLQRGHLFEPLQIEYSPTPGERDFMYGPGNGNAVNPIVDFLRDGINIWGQRTLQRTASALDRINVRRMLFFAEKSISLSSRFLVFEQDDEVLWDRFTGLVNPYLSSIASLRGLEEFQVICNASTNPPYRRNNNEMNAKIYLVPVKSAEKIIIDFALFPSGATFIEPSAF